MKLHHCSTDGGTTVFVAVKVTLSGPVAANAEVGLEVCFDVGPFEEDAAAALDVGDNAAALPVLDGADGSAEADRKGFFSDEPFGFGPDCVVVVVLLVHRF
jgi:hypothetical protein